MIGLKCLSIRFDKIDGFIRIYDGNRYLILFGPEKYDVPYNKIKYLISQISGIICIFHTVIGKSKSILMILDFA